MKKAIARVLSIAMLVVFIFSNNSTVFASLGTADGISGDHTLEEMFSLGQSGDYDNLNVRAGDEIRIPLTADIFTWSDGRTPLPLEAVRTNELTSAGIKVGTKRQSGNITLDYVQFETDVFDGKPFFVSGSTAKTGRTAYISVMFAEEFVSVEDQDFSFDIFVTTKGSTKEDCKITISGRMLVDEVEVDASNDSVSTLDGLVVKANEDTPKIAMDLGNGVTVKKHLVKGSKYYATSAVKFPYDPAFAEEYPDIYPVLECVYKLSTVNIRSGFSSEVTIKTPDDVLLYVYGDKMTYLGTTNDILPYSDLYFMSHLKIPTLEGVKYEGTLSGVPNSNVLEDTGNVNYNPTTGR